MVTSRAVTLPGPVLTVALMILLVLASASPIQAGPLTIGADLWCPYNCEQDAADPGYLVEIARLALGRDDREIIYRVLPWSSALEETRVGKMDVAIGVVSGNSGNLVLNRISLGRDQTVVVTRQDNPFVYSGPLSLQTLLLGVIADYTYDSNGPIDQYVLGRGDESQVVVLHRENALQLLIKMLEGRRLDAFLENRNVALHTIRQMGLEGRFNVQETGVGDDIYFAFIPTIGGQRLAQEFDKSLLQLDANGDIKRIMQKYGLPYTPLNQP